MKHITYIILASALLTCSSCSDFLEKYPKDSPSTTIPMSDEKVKKPNKVIKKIADDSEAAARRRVFEELFYDFHRSRGQVYLMNFTRGLFFGFGSVLGATLLVAISIWLLGQFGNIFPPLADFINNLIDAMQRQQ
jgi:hypothetical protein